MAQQHRSGGQALVDSLAVHGVEQVFGIPGTHNLAIYSALASSGIRHLTPRHEQGAGYAADGYARSSGRPGVVITTTGPAILNAAAAAAQAYSDSVPVLFIAPGMPLTHPSGGNGLLHEVRDQFRAMASVVGHAQRPTTVEDIPLAVAQCFAAMASGRPRPAYLEIPLDLLDAVGEVDVRQPADIPVTIPSDGPLVVAAELLKAAERPLIVAGGGANGAAGQLLAFAEACGAPVVTTANGKGVIPEDHPLSLGAGVHLATCADIVREADLVVAVGTELAPADWWYGPIPQSNLIRIDHDVHSIGTNAHATAALVGDSRVTLERLIERIRGIGGEPASPGARVDAWRARLRADAAGVGAAYIGLCQALNESIARDAIVAADQAMSCYYGLLGNLPLHVPRSFLFPAGLGTLGYALPAAIGAKVAFPDREVVAVLGDGGVMFSVAELAAAADAGLALPVIVVDNSGYGEIRNEMLERDGSVIAVDLPSPDFATLAQSVGCHGIRVTDRRNLASAIGAAFAADRPTLIHVNEAVTGS